MPWTLSAKYFGCTGGTAWWIFPCFAIHSFTHYRYSASKKRFWWHWAAWCGVYGSMHWVALMYFENNKKIYLEKIVSQKRLWGHSIAWCSVLAPNSTITRCYIALMHFKKQLKKIRLKSIVSQRRHSIAWCSVLAPTTPGAVWLSLSLPFIKPIIILGNLSKTF